MTGSPRARRGRLLASAAALCLGLTACGPTSTPSAPAPPAVSSTPVRTSAPPSPTHFADVAESAYRSSLSASRAAEESARSASAAPTSSPEEESAEPTSEAPSPEAAADPDVLPESSPVSFSIPGIDARSDLLRLLLRDDGALAVPPADPGSPAAWYANSPTPGERGPAVLMGHVNAKDGSDGVFARISELEPGDEIEVLREDGTTAVFAVDRGQRYGKDEFPTDEVYGNTDDAQLRLITCDGYNMWTRTFEENYIVYATLVGSRDA